MASNNYIVLNGLLTGDAGLYTSQSGRPKITFRMAVPRTTERKPAADFATVVCLGKRFMPLVSHLVKGAPVTVIGWLQSRDIPGGRTVTEVRAARVMVNVEIPEEEEKGAE